MGMREVLDVHASVQLVTLSNKLVLQSRHKAILIEQDSYLLELSRYAVINAVRTRVVARRLASVFHSVGNIMYLALFFRSANPG